MFSFRNHTIVINTLKTSFLSVILSVFCFTEQTALAQDCEPPCAAMDALESFQIVVDSEGNCAPVVATLTSDVMEPICGEFEFHWEIQGGAYEWNEGSSSTDSNPSIIFGEAVTYQLELTVSVVGATDCNSFTTTEYFSAASAPTVTTSTGGEICAYDEWETLVYVNPGNMAISNFAWILNGDSSLSTFPTPLTVAFVDEGEVEIVAWVENSCGSSSDSSIVQVRALPAVAVDSEYNWICEGAPVEMVASGAESYEWSSNSELLSGGELGDSLATFMMESAVIGGVEGTTTYGELTCSASAGFQVYSFFVPGLSIDGDDLICEGTEALFESTTQSFGYSTSSSWLFNDSVVNGSELDLTANHLPSGEYVVEAEVEFDPFPVWLQPNGCSGQAQFEFVIADLPQVEAPQNLTFCTQPVLESLPDGLPSGGMWSGAGVENGLFNPAGFEENQVALEYTFIDANGCSASDSSFIQLNEPVWANAGLDSTICESNDWANLEGFDEMESGTWSGPALIDPYAGLVDVGDLEIGQNTFIYSIDQGSCATSDTVDWEVMEHPVALLSTQGSLACDADTVWFQVFAGGGTLDEESNYTYEWSSEVQFTSDDEPYYVADIDQGFDFVQLELFDDMGCSDMASAFIEPLALPEIELPESWVVCDNDEDLLMPPTLPEIGIWMGPGVTSAAGTFNPGLLGVGMHEVTFTATGALGCSNVDSMAIEITELEVISGGPDRVVCAGSSDLVLSDYLPIDGGWWSGAGVIDSLLPAIAIDDLAVGIHEVIFHAGVESCAQTDTVHIEVLPLPMATTIGEGNHYCPADTIALSAMGVGGEGESTDGFEFEWFGADVLQEGGVFFMIAPDFGPDTLFADFTVTDSFGCSNDFQTERLIYPRPALALPAEYQACNQDILVSFPEAVPAGGQWNVPTGITTLESAFMPSDFGNGAWPLVYTFMDSVGCTASDTTILIVGDALSLEVESLIEVCEDFTEILLPTPPNLSGQWNGPGLINQAIGLLNGSDLGNGQFEYAYSIGEQSCLVSDTLMLLVHSLPLVSGEVTGSSCMGDSVFIELDVLVGDSAMSYQWSSPDSESIAAVGGTASVVWEASGVYSVEAIAIDANGCQGSGQWEINIDALPEVSAGENALFCAQSFAAELVGAFPASDANGTGVFLGLEEAESLISTEGTLDPVLLGLGTFDVAYLYFDSLTGCSNSDTLQVVIDPVPVISAGADTSFCDGADWVQFESVDFGFPVIWSGGGASEEESLMDPATGEVSLENLSPGIYSFIISGGEGSCAVSDQRSLEIHELPQITLPLESSTCAGDVNLMLPAALPTGGNWTGAGVADSTLGVFNAAVGEGDWNLEYHVTDALTNCGNSADHTVIVHGLPVAQFTSVQLQCIDVPFTIESTSISVDSHSWWLSDSLISDSTAATLTIENEGDFDLSLTVVNSWGCTDTLLQEVSLIAPPIAAFALSEDSGCAPFFVDVSDESTGAIDAVQWTIAGEDVGLDSDGFLVIDDVAEDMLLWFEMEVSNQCGVSVSGDSIAILTAPVVQVSPLSDSVCSPFQAEFAFDVIGTSDELVWDFGNGQTGTGANPEWPTYEAMNNPELFVASLSATNACGSAMDSTLVWVQPITAQAQFDLDVIEGCSPLQITATDQSSGSDMVSLDFGDGLTAMDSVASFIYDDSGEYTVVQTVSSFCAVDTFELTVTVHPQFEVNVAISEDSFCAGDSIEIAAIASGPANDVYLQWTGSGGSQVENSPFVYVSDSIGGQTIHAFAVDALHGCQASDSLEVIVHAPLTLVLEPSITSGCSPLELNVENETEGVGIWNWVYGSTGLSSSEFQPNFTLIQTGNDAEIQNIVVSVVSEWGCESSDSISIEVLPRPELDFSFEDSLLCGIPAQTIPVVTSPADLQLGWFINGTLVSANESPVLQFDELGQQVIELTGSNSFGCSSFSLDSLEVSATPQVGLSAAPLMGCAPHLLEIEHETLGAAEWSIEIAMDSFLVFETDEPIEEILLEVPGMYGLTLTAVSEFGCEAIATLTDSVTVLPRPTVGFLPDPYAGSFDSPHPLNSSWTFENTSDFGQSIWDFGDGELSSEWDASHTYDASGTYEVLLTVINDFGCAQEFMMMVDVQENLEVYVPNAFTPPEQGYADGINDGWRPVLSDPDLVDRYELMVYNRYGQLVWSTQDKDAYWVGEARNGGAYFAPGGIYTWVLQIDSNSFAESSRQWKGQVTLLR